MPNSKNNKKNDRSILRQTRLQRMLAKENEAKGLEPPLENESSNNHAAPAVFGAQQTDHVHHEYNVALSDNLPIIPPNNKNRRDSALRTNRIQHMKTKGLLPNASTVSAAGTDTSRTTTENNRDKRNNNGLSFSVTRPDAESTNNDAPTAPSLAPPRRPSSNAREQKHREENKRSGSRHSFSSSSSYRHPQPTDSSNVIDLEYLDLDDEDDPNQQQVGDITIVSNTINHERTNKDDDELLLEKKIQEKDKIIPKYSKKDKKKEKKNKNKKSHDEENGKDDQQGPNTKQEQRQGRGWWRRSRMSSNQKSHAADDDDNHNDIEQDTEQQQNIKATTEYEVGIKKNSIDPIFIDDDSSSSSSYHESVQPGAYHVQGRDVIRRYTTQYDDNEENDAYDEEWTRASTTTTPRDHYTEHLQQEHERQSTTNTPEPTPPTPTTEKEAFVDEKESKRRRRRLFLVMAISVGVIIVLAIGIGIGVALSNRTRNNNNIGSSPSDDNDNTNKNSVRPSSPPTPPPSVSASCRNALQVPLPRVFISCACNQTLGRPSDTNEQDLILLVTIRAALVQIYQEFHFDRWNQLLQDFDTNVCHPNIIALQWLLETAITNSNNNITLPNDMMTIVQQEQQYQNRFLLVSIWAHYWMTSNNMMVAAETNWLTMVSECSWLGAACQTQTIQTISSSSNRPSTTTTTTTTRMVVSTLELTPTQMGLATLEDGGIPTEIYLLRQLESLTLTNQLMRTSLSTEIGLLSQLTLLNLRNLRLRGRLPDSLFSLTKLSFLLLQQNSFSGSIPTLIGQLESLQYFDLTDSSMEGDLIPTEIGRLTDLRSFVFFGHPQGSGRMPTEFGLLTRLSYLDISETGPRFTFHTEFGRLTELTDFGLDFLGWTSNTDDNLCLPTEIGALTNLIRLRMEIPEAGTARCRGALPTEMGLLTKLQEYVAISQGLTGSLPSEMGHLTNLVALDLRATRLMGTIPTELGRLSALKSLSLHNVGLLEGSIPTSLNQLSPDCINLFGTQLSGTVPREWCVTAQNISISCNDGNDINNARLRACTCCQCGVFNGFQCGLERGVDVAIGADPFFD